MKFFLSVWKVPLVLLSGMFCLNSCHELSEKENNGREDHEEIYTFGNNDFILEVTRLGGMFVRFERTDNPLNPFGWHLQPGDIPGNNRPHVFAGHFLCSGRWGEPSPGEKEAGIPHNGEVNTQPWNIVDEFHDSDKQMSVLEMECEAPIEKLDVTRQLFVPDEKAFYVVKEIFTNNLPIGRPVNFVQHPTIAPPFLEKNTIVETNAREGFDQNTGLEFIEDSAFMWPEGILSSGDSVDLTQPRDVDDFVTSHVFYEDEEFGWCFAYNPDNDLLLGYVFTTSDYPWFNYWHHAKDGKPVVRGLEFGTTGFGKYYGRLIKENVSFMGESGIDFLDAGESVAKSYLCFQVICPSDDFWFDTSDEDIIVRCQAEEGMLDLIEFEKAVLSF